MDHATPAKRRWDDSEPEMSSQARPKPASFAPTTSGSAGAGGGKKMTFAERMMAKMGYQEGVGLGKNGTGILKPIEVVVRPQGVGVGAVSERTARERAETKRKARQRGEVVSSSDEDEDEGDSDGGRAARRKGGKEKGKGKKEPKKKAGTTGAAKVPKYRTSVDIEAAAAGLKVPAVIKSIIDATGPEQRTLESVSELAISSRPSVSAENREEKLAKQLRRDLEVYVEQWNGLARQRLDLVGEEQRVKRGLDRHQKDLDTATRLAEAAERLMSASAGGAAADGPDAVKLRWENTVEELLEIQLNHKDEIGLYKLPDLAVSAIKEPFQAMISNWSPLDDPSYLVSTLSRLRPILGMGPESDPRKAREGPTKKSTTPYETLIYTVWFPRIRAVVTNEWDPEAPDSMLALVMNWMDLIPDFVFNRLVNGLVVQRLSDKIERWKPRGKGGNAAPPHSWLFPWLPFVSGCHLDPRDHTGLLYATKQKFRQLLQTWDLADGPVPGIGEWKEILGDELDHILVSKLVPRLARLLATEFTVYPPEQDIKPIEQVLAWDGILQSAAMSLLLASEVFPKVLDVLHTWLVSDEVNYEEIADWYDWWKRLLPESVDGSAEVAQGWYAATCLMADALDLEAAGFPRRMLPKPEVVSERDGGEVGVEAARERRRKNGDSKRERAKEEEEQQQQRKAAEERREVTFFDILAEWAEEQSLMVIPLREVDPATAAPIFRITGNANAKGGVKVYVHEDTVWAQSRGSRESWQPVNLGEELLALARASLR